MPLTNNNRQLLDLATWEPLEATVPNSPQSCFVASHHVKHQVFINSTNSGNLLYRPAVDGTVTIPAFSVSATTTAGFASCWSTGSTVGVASLTATAGSTSTITTNQTLRHDLRGWPIHILEGPNAGVTLTIRKNTVGANSVITVDTQASAFDSTTKYRLMTPRFYFFMAPGGTPSLRAYDYATGSDLGLTSTGLPTWSSIGSAALTGCTSWVDTSYLQFATGTATGGTTNTISNSAKSWSTNQWTGAQVRVTSGTGAGQIRIVSSNTSTQITTSSNWTVTPDNTSNYSIEPNDDFLYLIGGSAVTLYRYQISTNTWTTISPSVARGGVTSTNPSLFCPFRVTSTDWNDETNFINGTRLYSHRGGSGDTSIDVYNITTNSWSSLTFNPPGAVGTGFGNIGVRAFLTRDKIYWQNSAFSDSFALAARWVSLDLTTQEIEPWVPSPKTSTISTSSSYGHFAFWDYYKDGNSYVEYGYQQLPVVTSSNWSNNILYRCMII